jgi:hypothetical protein
VKRLVIAAAAAVFAVPAVAADVSATIAISQPGFYGQINIGGFPQPQVIYAQPVYIHRPPSDVVVQPMYLRVPPGHEKNWSKHCQEYGACGRPVYFVREDWYQRDYVPRQHQQKGGDQGQGHNQDGDKGHGKGKDK